jgi:hypothetical protein
MSLTTRHGDTLQKFFDADPFRARANDLPNSDLESKDKSRWKLCHIYKIGRGSSTNHHSSGGGFVTDVRQ